MGTVAYTINVAKREWWLGEITSTVTTQTNENNNGHDIHPLVYDFEKNIFNE